MSVVQFPRPVAAPAALDDELQSDLLEDCQHLADECQERLRILASFAYPESGVFILSQYEQFLRNRKVPDYLDALKALANKMHGLKGVLGFLIAEAKQLCHLAEDLVKPLAQGQLVLDRRLHGLLTRIVYELQSMLETYVRRPDASFPLGAWPQRIESAREEAAAFVQHSRAGIAALLSERGRDDGAIRRREAVVQVSVSRDGYEELVDSVHQLYAVIAKLAAGASLLRANRLYNGFLDQHQRIKKMPLDVSRYERLVPSLAESYKLRARFEHRDAGVRADHEFWAAVHEIANHMLKNAIIHGIEPPLERLRADKEEVGRIALELSEELLHIGILISDDGRGIDAQRIGRKAVEQGLMSEERLAGMTRAEMLELVFEQGVSTKEQVDDNAGRGIGLSAVRQAMQRYQGTCRIESESGRGTRWHFRFPKTNVSLACFVIRIGSYPLVIPEAHVRLFAAYAPERLTSVQSHPVYRQGDLLVPLVDTRELFQAGIAADASRTQRLLVVQDDGPPLGLVFNDVLDKGILPIQPLGDTLGIPSGTAPGGTPDDSALFIGATLHGAEPALVLSVRALRAAAGSH